MDVENPMVRDEYWTRMTDEELERRYEEMNRQCDEEYERRREEKWQS